MDQSEPFPGTELELDLLTLVARLEQLDREDPPSHWLWSDRIIACDVARLRRRWIGAEAQAWAEGTIGDGLSPTSLSADAPQPVTDTIGAES